MATWENLSIVIALLLAAAAALASGDPQARHDVASFVAAALRPQAADFLGVPGSLSGTDTAWLLPPPSDPAAPKERQSALRMD